MCFLMLKSVIPATPLMVTSLLGVDLCYLDLESEELSFRSSCPIKLIFSMSIRLARLIFHEFLMILEARFFFFFFLIFSKFSIFSLFQSFVWKFISHLILNISVLRLRNFSIYVRINQNNI